MIVSSLMHLRSTQSVLMPKPDTRLTTPFAKLTGAVTSSRPCPDGSVPRRWRPCARSSPVRTQRFPCPLTSLLIACACFVRRGPGHAVRTALSNLLLFTKLSHRPLSTRSLRESLGISADGSEKAFSAKDIESMIARPPPPILYNVREPEKNICHAFVAVDPSGGGASAFSIASIVQDHTGFTHVRPLPSAPPPCPAAAAPRARGRPRPSARATCS